MTAPGRRSLRRALAAVALAIAAVSFPRGGAALDGETAGRALAIAGDKLARTAARLPPDRLPHATGLDGLWRTVGAGDRVGWTQGFFPGSLWYLHEHTGDPAWRARAERFTWPLEPQKDNTETHDVGFKLFPSFGNAHRLTGEDRHRAILLAGAASLATRFRPEVGAIDCCDWNPEWRLPVVIDTMMNLELLLWASQHGGDPSYAELALSHALRTRADLVRPDGGTFHVADYEPGSGALRWRGTFQGAGDASTWSRGQAWAVYGFTLVHRYTGDPRMLDAARRTADFFLARLPPHGVPRWDLDVAAGPEDSSAAAVLASALLELATFVPEPAGSGYRTRALLILDALVSPAYLDARATTEGLLLHGAGHVPAGREVDVSLVYGDYYFVEALLRARPWPPPSGAGDGGGSPGGDGDGTAGGDGGSPGGDGNGTAGGDGGSPGGDGDGTAGGDGGSPGGDGGGSGGGEGDGGGTGGEPEKPGDGPVDGEGPDAGGGGPDAEVPPAASGGSGGGCSSTGATSPLALLLLFTARPALRYRLRSMGRADHSSPDARSPRRLEAFRPDT